MEQPTHTLRKTPHISVSRLADYMAASEQARRTIAQSCKYRPIARVIQHVEARGAISAAYTKGSPDLKALKERAESIRRKIADSDFEADVNDHNASYVARFAEVAPSLKLPAAEISAGAKFPTFVVSDVRITFALDLRLHRLTRTNEVRVGGAMLRYAKQKALPPLVAEFQSAFVYGRLCEIADALAGMPEKKLCLTIDAQDGVVYEAPTRSVYLYKEMGAACQAIAERWPAIKPPKGAVIEP